MNKLREIYDTKKQLITNDITELGIILKENSNINIVDINPDNTIYLESNCGVDSIRNILDSDIIKWINYNIEAPINMIYNTLPLSNTSCIIRI